MRSLYSMSLQIQSEITASLLSVKKGNCMKIRQSKNPSMTVNSYSNIIFHDNPKYKCNDSSCHQSPNVQSITSSYRIYYMCENKICYKQQYGQIRSQPIYTPCRGLKLLLFLEFWQFFPNTNRSKHLNTLSILLTP